MVAELTINKRTIPVVTGMEAFTITDLITVPLPPAVRTSVLEAPVNDELAEEIAAMPVLAVSRAYPLQPQLSVF